MSKRTVIDKEAMFQKIMPTASTPPPEPAHTAAPPAPQPMVREVGLPAHEAQELVLVNIMEYLVAEKLDAAFEKFKCCRCDKCRKDVAAIALNKLPPKYVVVTRESIGAYTALASTQEVTTAIVQAVLQVRASPRH